MIYLCIIGWIAVGIASHIFWWTRSWDFTAKEIPATFWCAVVGPIAFIIGAFVHGEDLFDDRVLIKGKRRKP